MAELATIARPYAEAAFELAREDNALPVWSQMLALRRRVVADARVQAALDNPKLVARRQGIAVLVGRRRRASTGDGRSFLRVLIESDRVMLLPEIRATFDALKDSAESVATRDIETAFPLIGRAACATQGGARAPFRQDDRGDGRR